MHLLDEVKSIYWLLILSVILCIPLYFVPLLWDSNLVTETEKGPWIGPQTEHTENDDTHDNESHGH